MGKKRGLGTEKLFKTQYYTGYNCSNSPRYERKEIQNGGARLAHQGGGEPSYQPLQRNGGRRGGIKERYIGAPEITEKQLRKIYAGHEEKKIRTDDGRHPKYFGK